MYLMLRNTHDATHTTKQRSRKLWPVVAYWEPFLLEGPTLGIHLVVQSVGSSESLTCSHVCSLLVQHASLCSPTPQCHHPLPCSPAVCCCTTVLVNLDVHVIQGPPAVDFDVGAAPVPPLWLRLCPHPRRSGC